MTGDASIGQAQRRKRPVRLLFAALSCLSAGAAGLWWFLPQHHETYTTVGLGVKQKALRIWIPFGWKVDQDTRGSGRARSRDAIEWTVVYLTRKPASGLQAWIDRLFHRNTNKEWSKSFLAIDLE